MDMASDTMNQKQAQVDTTSVRLGQDKVGMTFELPSKTEFLNSRPYHSVDTLSEACTSSEEEYTLCSS